MFAVFVILPQFCLILLGYLLTKRPSFAKKDFWNVTEKLVFYVLFPPLIFLSVAKANLQIGQCSYFLLISISAMSIAVITAWLANFLIKESQWTKWSERSAYSENLFNGGGSGIKVGNGMYGIQLDTDIDNLIEFRFIVRV